MYSKMPTKPKICIIFRFGLHQRSLVSALAAHETKVDAYIKAQTIFRDLIPLDSFTFIIKGLLCVYAMHTKEFVLRELWEESDNQRT